MAPMRSSATRRRTSRSSTGPARSRFGTGTATASASASRSGPTTLVAQPRSAMLAWREATAVLDAVALDKLRERHMEDHVRLYDRAELELGELVDLPTDERIRAVAAGGNDPDLVALMFNFGRYLLMASSRP